MPILIAAAVVFARRRGRGIDGATASASACSNAHEVDEEAQSAPAAAEIKGASVPVGADGQAEAPAKSAPSKNAGKAPATKGANKPPAAKTSTKSASKPSSKKPAKKKYAKVTATEVDEAVSMRGGLDD